MNVFVAAWGAALGALALPASAFGQIDEEPAVSREAATEAHPPQEESAKEPAAAAGEAPVKDPFEELTKEPVYDPSKPVPAGYVLEREPRRWMLIAGGSILAGSYALALFIAIKKRQDEMLGTFSPGWLMIPVVGPWIAAATAHAKCGYEGSTGNRTYHCRPSDGEGLALLGGIQTVGLVLLVAAYRTSTERLVRAGVSVSLVPIGREGYGLGVSGSM